MQQLSRGILISVEGIDGSGKSTLCTRLAQSLQKHMSVILTKEPGGTQLGAQLRAIVQKPIKRCAQTEFLLFAADRAQHFNELVLPALDQHKLVISDRMADSSLVYQGYGRGLDMNMITGINKWAMNNRAPDITIYIRIPLATALARLAKRKIQLTSFEQEEHSFTKKLIDGFDRLYANRKDVITIDGTQSIERVESNALHAVTTYLSSITI